MAGAHIEAAMLAAAAKHTVTFGGSDVDDDGVLRYQIVVFDGRSQWVVHRRYREFLRVFDAVKDDCAGCPAFPPKSQVLMRFSESFRSQRYHGLEAWLTALVQLDPTLEAAPELEAFLRPAANLSDGSAANLSWRSFSSRSTALSRAWLCKGSGGSTASSKRWMGESSACSTECSQTWMGRSSATA